MRRNTGITLNQIGTSEKRNASIEAEKEMDLSL
jgi:hypothetical protein